MTPYSLVVTQIKKKTGPVKLKRM